MRLHGRNAETWNVKGAAAASDRFNYDYSPTELAAVATHIGGLARMRLETRVVFNTNMEDQGQRNARSLMDELVRARAPMVRSAEPVAI